MSATTPTASRDHFSRIARKWSHFGPPLRPSPDDTSVVQRVVADLGGAAHAVVLGLTPEILACDWPADIMLSAVDHSPAMIDSLWPPEKGPANSNVVLADWCDMPIPSGTIDLVTGDGCYILQRFPDGYEALTREVKRVLRRAVDLSFAFFCVRIERSPSRISRARWPMVRSAAYMHSSCDCWRRCMERAVSAVVSTMCIKRGCPCLRCRLRW